MRLSQRTFSILLILSCVFLLGYLGFAGYRLFIQNFSVVASFTTGPDRRIQILADSLYDNGQGFYYTVEVQNKMLVPPSFVGGGDDYRKPVFKLLYSKDRNVVGIVEESNPNILYAIHDFGSGETWPGSDRSREQRLPIGIRLRDRLQADTHDYTLMLSDDVPDDVPRKLG